MESPRKRAKMQESDETKMSHTIDIYRWTGSPPSQAVMMVAHILNIKLNPIEVDILTEEQLKPEFLKVNPYHTLPTIVDGDVTLRESRNILTYLVEKYATDDMLYPKDVVLRAHVNQCLFFDSEMYNDFGSFYYPTLYDLTGDKARHAKAVKSLEIFEKDLAGHAYAAGDHLTVADITLAVTISVIESFGFDLTPYPNIVAWFAKCKEEIGGYKEFNQHGLDQLQTRDRYKAVKV